MSKKPIWFWVSSLILLLTLLTVGIVLAVTRYTRASEIEISIQPEKDLNRSIYITGNISMPGLYPYSTTDTIDELLRAAGGLKSYDDVEIRLNVVSIQTGYDTQKIDINRADVWLLKALPGIGETLAQRIVDYRELNGPFHNTTELINVAGISNNILYKIQEMVTIADR